MTLYWMLGAAVGRLGAATPAPDFNEDTVTPGWQGFAITFGIVAVTVLLLLDMVRRVRRTRYRGEIRELIEEERAKEARETGKDEL